MKTMMLIRRLLLLLFTAKISNAKLLDKVKNVEWTLSLPQSSIRKGNGVVSTSNNKLLVTTAEGRFHVIDSNRKAQTLNPPDGTLLCTSEPVLMPNDPNAAVFVIQAADESRVIAVNLTDATPLWHVDVQGLVAGSPAVSQDGTIYVTHNRLANGRLIRSGQISVIRDKIVVATLPRSQESTNTPFAPPSVVTTEETGDVVVFGDSRDSGFSQFGSLYALTWSKDHAVRKGSGVQSYVFRRLPTTVRSSVTAPALAEDLRVYLGTQGSLIVGWDQGAQTTLFQTGNQVTLYPWGSLMEFDSINYFAPIPASPVLSDDGNTLFAVGAGAEVAASDLVQGFKLWQDASLNSPVSAKAVYQGSTDSPVVYFVEKTGILHQKEASTGRTQWSFDFRSNIEAEFTLSNSGNLVIAGDTNGNIKAIKVAEFDTPPPTHKPTAAPVVKAPGPSPTTLAPVAIPRTSQPVPAPVTSSPASLRPTISTVKRSFSPTRSTTLSEVTNSPSFANPTLKETAAAGGTLTEQSSAAKGDTEDKVSFGLVPIIGAAAGVCLLCLLTCAVMVLRIRLAKRRKNRDSKSRALDNHEAARRFEAERLAYEQECAQNEHDLLDALATGSTATKAITEVSPAKSWDTDSMSPSAKAPESQQGEHSAHSRSFGFEVSVDDPSLCAESVEDLEGQLSAMVSPESPNLMLPSTPSPIKKIQSFDGSQSSPMGHAEKLRSVRSLDGKVPVQPVRELLEVRSFDDESAASSKISGFTGVISESTGAIAAAVGAALSTLSFQEEKKETDSVASVRSAVDRIVAPSPEMRRVKSADTNSVFTDLSTPTQSARILSLSQRTSSPSDLISVDTSSIYYDEHSVVSPQPAAREAIAEEAAETVVVAEEAEIPIAATPTAGDAFRGRDEETVESDCPEDEGMGMLRPGSAYLSRHNENKIMDPPIEVEADPVISVHNRMRPIYKGVSVRPSTRSRAGLFSRRQPRLSAFTDDDGTDSDATEQLKNLPVNLGPKRSERLKAQHRPLSPNSASATSEEGPPPKFTTHGYYVEEPDDSKLHMSMEGDEDPNLSFERKSRRRSKTKRKPRATKQASSPEKPSPDAWSSFLSELTKVENTFFGANAFMSTGESTHEEARRSAAEVSDEESALPPPKPPRTFYA